MATGHRGKTTRNFSGIVAGMPATGALASVVEQSPMTPEQAQQKIAAMYLLEKDIKTAFASKLNAVNAPKIKAADLLWAETQVDTLAVVLRDHGTKFAIDLLSSRQPDQIRSGLTMLVRIADVSQDARDSEVRLLAADMLSHCSTGLGQDKNAVRYRAVRNNIVREYPGISGAVRPHATALAL